jgi:HK97 family phage major capsid protein
MVRFNSSRRPYVRCRARRATSGSQHKVNAKAARHERESIMNFKNSKDLESWANRIEETVEKLSTSEWNARYMENKAQGPSEETYAAAGDWIRQAVKQSHPDTKVRERIKNIDERLVEKWTEKAKLGTPLYSDAVSGSYTVPQGFYGEVARVAELASVCMNKVTRVPMVTQQVVFPIESTGLSVKWVSAQSSSHSEINPTFTQATLNCKTVGGYIPLSMGELEDNGIAVAQNFFTAWGEAFGQEIDKQVLSANADPFTGVLFNGSSQTYQMGTGASTYSDMSVSDMDNLQAELTLAKYRKGAEFFLNQLTYDVLRNLKTAEGDYVIAPWAADPFIWKGSRLNITDVIATPVANKPFVGYFNPKFVFMGMRKDLELKIYDATFYAPTEDEVILSARARLSFAYPLTDAYAIMKTATA